MQTPEPIPAPNQNNYQKDLIVPGQPEPRGYYDSTPSLITPDWQPGDYQPDSSKPNYNPYNKPHVIDPTQHRGPGRYDRQTPIVPGAESVANNPYNSKRIHLPAGVFSVQPAETAPGAYQPDSSKPNYNPYNKPKLNPLAPVPGKLESLVVVKDIKNKAA